MIKIQSKEEAGGYESKAGPVITVQHTVSSMEVLEMLHIALATRQITGADVHDVLNSVGHVRNRYGRRY